MPNEIPADAKRQVLLEYKSTDNQARLKTLDDTLHSYDFLGYPFFIAGGADSWCLNYSNALKISTAKLSWAGYVIIAEIRQSCTGNCIMEFKMLSKQEICLMLEHQSFFLLLLQDRSDICINIYKMH